MKKTILTGALLVPLLLATACAGGPQPNMRVAATPAPTPSAALERITASAWGIADAETGELIASKDPDTPHKSASITKVMTALLVTELAAADPSVLDETVVFSEAAVARKGTKSGLKAHESLRVGDALYALLLPSGNDVGYAFAQHFNRRFSPDDESVNGRGFIAAMNRKAQALGMRHTIYRSSFGDGGTVDDRTTSVGDLMILARAATAQPLLHKVVGTRSYTTQARGADGAMREVGWTNTNRLLADSQVSGIKTGTTKNAGACLLTEVTIGGRRYHVAVLGSTSSDQRYVDTQAIIDYVKALRRS